LPALITLGVTVVYPVAWTLWLSLNGPDTALRGTPDFRGLDNYLRIGGSSEFRAALVNTLGLTAASFLLEAGLGLAMALALHRSLRGSRVFRAIVALPLMVAPVVGAHKWTHRQKPSYQYQGFLRYPLRDNLDLRVGLSHQSGGENRMEQSWLDDSQRSSKWSAGFAWFFLPGTQLAATVGRDIAAEHGFREDSRLNIRLLQVF
jgi:ABC-type sugar transport system permease subunit